MAASTFDKVAECPRIWGFEVGRAFQHEDGAWDLDMFYSSMTYGMSLDVRRVMLEPDDSACCFKYRLVSLIARQTKVNVIDGNTEGHYVAVCSSRSAEGGDVIWHKIDDQNSRSVTVTDVLGFTGDDGTPVCGRKNKKLPKENMLFAHYLEYVREDCLDDYYNGIV